jgi:hypothetical protein
MNEKENLIKKLYIFFGFGLASGKLLVLMMMF